MSGFLSRPRPPAIPPQTLATRQRQGHCSIVGLRCAALHVVRRRALDQLPEGPVLVWRGRFDEAARLARRGIPCRRHQTQAPVVQYIAHLASVELACHRRIIVLARRHAERNPHYADRVRTFPICASARCSSARARPRPTTPPGPCATCRPACTCRHEEFRTRAPAASAGRSSATQYGSGRFDEAAATAVQRRAMARQRHHRGRVLASMVRAPASRPTRGTVVNVEAEQYLIRAESGP